MTEEQKQQRIVEREAEEARLLAGIAAADRWIATLEELKRRYGVGWMHRSNRIHDRLVGALCIATPCWSGSLAAAVLSSLGARRSCCPGFRTWRTRRESGTTGLLSRPDSSKH
jgi:hypothetical protein